MTFLKEIWKNIVSNLTDVFAKEEAEAFAFVLINHTFHKDKPHIIANSIIEVTHEQHHFIDKAIGRLLSNEPIQYIIGSAPFWGREFRVNPSVLIPRPETEELINIALSKIPKGSRILDVGTGSGIIAITLALELPQSEIVAIDISEEAIKLAKENADLLDAKVEFVKVDFLKESLEVVDKFDLLISNPPYLTNRDRELMHKNVLDYEPSNALFVPQEDPLIFYKRMIELRANILKTNGMIIAEINENYGDKIANLFEVDAKGIQIIKDINDKDRIMLATY